MEREFLKAYKKRLYLYEQFKSAGLEYLGRHFLFAYTLHLTGAKILS
jgi:hypothetical protein